MDQPTPTTRRGFLKLSATAAAAVAGVGLVACRSAGLSWEGESGGPDFPHRLLLEIPEEHQGVQLTPGLVVETPRGIFTYTFENHVAEKGLQVLTLPLLYPFEGFVIGEYSYMATVKGDSLSLRTDNRVRYSVSPFHWLG